MQGTVTDCAFDHVSERPDVVLVGTTAVGLPRTEPASVDDLPIFRETGCEGGIYDLVTLAIYDVVTSLRFSVFGLRIHTFTPKTK